ncbi:hypothetical protein FHETE_977 [Fusarium heterosporum]|uniref:Uncharacterized protein n=1 Tax=Fusarium heterosporum TaxID=42747 RepID=A0A8H5TZN5_FUSHE|nr:hypothetical protein FHETE_977 [Fusarium heterosporum]
MSENTTPNVKLIALSGDNNVWTVEQGDNTTPSQPPTMSEPPKNHVPIEYSSGSVSYKGYVEPDTLDIDIAPTMGAVDIGNIHGTLKDGVDLKVDLENYKGTEDEYGET